MSQIVVLGMHRSGTSCLVKSLHVAGAWVCDLSRGGSRRRRRAVMEDPVVRGINNGLLASVGARWDQPPRTDQAFEIDQAELSDALNPYDQHADWVIKDPRFLLTWPAWKSKLSNCHLLASIRSPLAVAESLNRRNEMPLAKGVALWLHYNQRLLAIASEQPVAFILFDDNEYPYHHRLEQMCRSCDLVFGPEVESVMQAKLIRSAARITDNAEANKLWSTLRQEAFRQLELAP